MAPSPRGPDRQYLPELAPQALPRAPSDSLTSIEDAHNDANLQAGSFPPISGPTRDEMVNDGFTVKEPSGHQHRHHPPKTPTPPPPWAPFYSARPGSAHVHVGRWRRGA